MLEIVYLLSYMRRFSIILMSLLFLFVCAIEGMTPDSASHNLLASCSASCQPHSQPNLISVVDRVVKNEKEPIPPATIFTVITSLGILYVGFIASSKLRQSTQKLYLQNSLMRF